MNRKRNIIVSPTIIISTLMRRRRFENSCLGNLKGPEEKLSFSTPWCKKRVERKNESPRDYLIFCRDKDRLPGKYQSRWQRFYYENSISSRKLRIVVNNFTIFSRQHYRVRVSVFQERCSELEMLILSFQLLIFVRFPICVLFSQLQEKQFNFALQIRKCHAVKYSTSSSQPSREKSLDFDDFLTWI